MARSRSSGTKRRRQPAKRQPRQWLPALWIAGAALIVVAALWWLGRSDIRPRSTVAGGVEAELEALAGRHGCIGDRLEIDRTIRKIDGVFVRSWRLVFPGTAAREEFIAEAVILGDRADLEVSSVVNRGGTDLALRVDHGIESFDLELVLDRPPRRLVRPTAAATPTEVPPTPTPRPAPPPGARGRLAILLDDAGQNRDLLAAVIGLPDEIGVAVLPFLPYSTETAVALGQAGHEIWLHLPMEAVGSEDPGPGALTVAMSGDELRDAVHLAINNVPNLVGVNNHMGSRATADLRMMTRVMQELAAMDLAFLDSRTTVNTVAEEAARAQGVATGRRHVFLDNERSAVTVRRQLDEAVYRALMDGEIVAIGHLNQVTVGVLNDEIPRLSERGITLVRPSELMD
jgi:polysaccharide deacetylase 2 family uncharacterized protein YibQ